MANMYGRYGKPNMSILHLHGTAVTALGRVISGMTLCGAFELDEITRSR